MITIYNILISLAYAIIKIIKIFIPKLNDREKGAARTFKFFIEDWEKHKKIWFHASSMGEFEQAKPIIERIKRQNSYVKIVCTFYSPSGYNSQRNYPFADAVFYMPIDKKSKAQKFVDVIDPDIAIFVRYDAWLNHISYAKSKGIPLLLINATVPKFIDNILIKPFYRTIYSHFNEIYAVNQEHYDRFQSLEISPKIYLSSDTRFDRIIEKVDAAKDKKILPQSIFEDRNVLVAGSVWGKDFDLIAKSVADFNQMNEQKITTIFAPHEPEENFIKHIESNLEDSIRLSILLKRIENGEEVKLPQGSNIIVDSIGKLLSLYGNGSLAFVGGAFGVGVHSLTEPAGYGLPVFCGPNCFNSPDAKDLIRQGALKIVDNWQDFLQGLSRVLKDESERNKQGLAAYNYVHSASGESQRIAELILKMIEK